jgi:molybdopterin converting factor small subunit
MKLKLLFFGALTDVVSNKQQIVDGIDTKDVKTLDSFLKLKYPVLNSYKYKIAVNQQIINENKLLNDGDEIAFLPPFAGG